VILRHRRFPWRRTIVRQPADGQALVEFAMVIPIFIFMLLAFIEFAFVFNAVLAINFATRDAALIGAEAGADANADCAILAAIGQDVSAPANPNHIQTVVIYRTDRTGSLTAYAGQADTYVRGGSLACHRSDGTPYTEDYTLASSGYLPISRCNVLSGCTGGRALDIIGVQVTYTHHWVTPLRGLGGVSGTSTTITQSNSMRMEPQT
jgi:Flp pilus assembly protein TadG